MHLHVDLRSQALGEAVRASWAVFVRIGDDCYTLNVAGNCVGKRGQA
jgi:hypothetical protein